MKLSSIKMIEFQTLIAWAYNSIPIHLLTSSCCSLQFYQYFLSAEGCGYLTEGRGRLTFWLQSIRFLRGLRGIFAVSCGLNRISLSVEVTRSRVAYLYVVHKPSEVINGFIQIFSQFTWRFRASQKVTRAKVDVIITIAILYIACDMWDVLVFQAVTNFTSTLTAALLVENYRSHGASVMSDSVRRFEI